MKKNYRSLTVIFSATLFLLTSGIVFSQENTGFKINKVNSNKARVLNVKLQTRKNSVVVKGLIRNLFKSRTPIPGHVDISVVDVSDKTINTTPVSIFKLSKKSQFARFKKTLKISSVAGSTIRITHHNAALGANALDSKYK